MMKRLLIATFAATLAIAANALDLLPQPGSQKGEIVFVNNQSRLPTNELEAVCRQVEKATKCRAVLGDAASGQVQIEVVDDADSPILAAFPEDYRAKVNIRKLDKNLKGKALDKFFASRCRKELLRAFCFACGAGGSQYPDNIMAIGDICDLDLVEEFIPGDTAYACVARLIKVGVTPIRLVTYAKACKDGWAPAPTNDVQKAIWDKVHALPTAPIKIKPEEKKTEK